MTNIANMSATLTLAGWEFNNGLKQSETAAMEFANTVDVQSRRASAAIDGVRNPGQSKLPQVLQQAGYALQDFSSQFSTRGLAGGIGAITNNIQAMGASLGGSTAAALAVGAAVGGMVLPPVIEWLNGTKEINAQIKAIEDKYSGVATRAKELAEIERRGNIDKAREEIQGRIDVGNRAREEVIKSLQFEKNAVAKMRQELNQQTMLRVPLPFGAGDIRLAPDGAAGRQLENDIRVRQAAVDTLQKQHDQLMNDVQAARQLLGRLDPSNARIAERENEEAALKAYDKENEAKNARRKAAQEISLKARTEFGSEQMKLETRLSDERQRLILMEVDKETIARSDAMAAVHRKRLEISQAEKKLADMGQEAGMSAGVERSSAAGVQAINRAIAGRQTEQSLAREQLKELKGIKDSLEEIVRTGGQLPKIYQFNGGNEP